MADHSPSPGTSKRNRLNEDQHLIKHISKSATELNGSDRIHESVTTIGGTLQKAKSTANPPTVTGVIQKTHGFFSTLKHRLSRGRSRERAGRKSPNDFLEHESTDYAADYSSENSSSVTPANSPRHRATTIDDSTTIIKSIKNRIEIGMSQTNKNLNEYEMSNEDMDTNDSVTNISPITLERLQAEEMQRKREANLRQHVFFQLRIHLRYGQNLVAMDKSGTSDPYVKFKLGGRLLHKSRTVHRDLNPTWDEIFVVPIEDPFQPIIIKVFDYDWGLQDDFMGSSKLDLTQLELGRAQDMKIKLEDPSRPNRELGDIFLTVTLWPRTQEDKEMHFQRNQKLADSSKRLKSQIWSSVVTIVLIEAKNLPKNEDGFKLSEPHIRFRLGNEKYKSKTSWNARWLEQFDLHLFDEDQLLELTLWNRSTMYGKCTIDLSLLPRETTHNLWQQFEDCSGEVFMVLTISGTTASETISDLTLYKEDQREKNVLLNRYSLKNSFQNLRDIGHLTVKVHGATGLAAADIGGKSDPFCVIELVNARLQTQTEYKTLTPNWNKIFTFNVKDITSVLEITVYDEDRDHKVEFLGKIAIPLLRIQNDEKRWYTLKDKNLVTKAKGTSPQILLEMTVVWNPVRATIRTLTPKEEKFLKLEQKFKRQVFLRNVSRFKSIIMYAVDFGKYINKCVTWESPIRSITALIIWILGCIYAEIWTIPLILLLIILKNWFVRWITGASVMHSSADIFEDDDDDDDDDDSKEKEEKKTIKERLQAIQETSQTVQNTIGFLASLGESVKNTFNFSVPELTWLAAILLICAFLVLYLIPLRILLIIWGIFKFSKRLIRPHSIPNNEILDFLSRVPNDEELIQFRELPSNIQTDSSSRRDPRKKQKAS